MRRRIQTAPQCFFGVLEKLAHQGCPPAIPQRWIGGADVRDRQRIEIVQPGFSTDEVGESIDYVRIGNVLALRRGGHGQVLSHQPRDQFGIVIGQAVTTAERHHVFGTEARVIAAASFADVVEQSSDVKQFDLFQLADRLGDGRKLLLNGRIVKAPHLPNHHHRMGIDGVDVK